MIGDVLKKFGENVVSNAPTPAPAPSQPQSSVPWPIIIAGGGIAAYLLLRKKTKKEA